MKDIFNLRIVAPKEKNMGAVYWSMGNKGESMFFDVNQELILTLEHSKILFAEAVGISIIGHKPIALFPSLLKKKYQSVEVFLAYARPTAAQPK